jgi:hypothetical protein
VTTQVSFLVCSFLLLGSLLLLLRRLLGVLLRSLVLLRLLLLLFLRDRDRGAAEDAGRRNSGQAERANERGHRTKLHANSPVIAGGPRAGRRRTGSSPGYQSLARAIQ